MKNIGPFTVKKSLIPNAGKGLFANKDIPAGTYLFVAFARHEIDNAPDDKTFEHQFFQCYPNHFINHSENPNVENVWLGEWTIVKRVLKPIKAGEEILSSYTAGMDLIKQKGYSMNNWKPF